MADKLATEADLTLVLEEEAESRLLSLALELATGKVQNYTRQTLIKVMDDVVRLRGSWSGFLGLPQRPVLEVGLVRIGTPPVTVAVSAYTWDSMGLYRPDGYWGGSREVIEVTYDHGYEQSEIPQDLRDVTVALAKRRIESGEPITSERIGSYGVSYNSEALALTKDEKDTLGRYRPRAYSLRT